MARLTLQSEQWQARWWLPLALLAPLVALGAVVAGAELPLTAWLAVLAAPFALAVLVACIYRPTLAIWLTLALLFFGNRPEIPLLFFWGRYIATAGIALFVVAMLARRLISGALIFRGQPLIVWYGLFALVALVSAAYNGTTLRDVALSLLTYLRYPLFLVLLLTAELPLAFYRRVMRVFVWLALLQVPVCLVQFSRGLQGDFLTGTMGSNGALVAVVLVSQCALLAEWLTTGRHTFRTLVLIGVLIVPTLLADVQIGLAFFPLLAAYMLARHYGVRRIWALISRWVLIGGLAAALILGASLAVPAVRAFLSVLPEHVANIADWNNPAIVKFASVGRLAVIPFSFPLLLEDPVRLAIGFGPEATQGGLITASIEDATLGENLSGGVVCRRLDAQGASCREPQAFRALMDFGFLGSLLYVVPLLGLWRAAKGLRRSANHTARTTWLLFEGISLFYILLGVWYIGVWRLDSYCFAFWLLAAAVWAALRVEKEAKGGQALP
jgi:hypothetical protein